MPTLRAYSGFSIAGVNDDQPSALGRIGTLEVRLARKPKDVRRAQRLRYRVFFEERGMIADATTRISRRDVDPYDAICDHVLVLDHNEKLRGLRRKPRVVGTYRLLRQHLAEQNGGFYTANEFDIAPLIARHPQASFMELGRSCVLPAYRTKRTVELLWHGIWSHVLRNKVDVMFGCASFDGTDPQAHAEALSFLHHYAAPPAEWSAKARAGRGVPTNIIPKDKLDAKAALRALPPLIKGYLRIGAYVSPQAVIDYEFRSIDVLIVLPTSAISERYIQHFGPGAERHAA
ncbi:GNAT family N-acetyltransferase [Variibacter gotjawalensis]|nr:GNAT family N-acyltransferase [Variibacter gotjawalensis]